MHNTTPPRMFPEFKRMIQLRKDTILGDWYLDEDQTVIRLYVFEEEPYKSLAFLTPMIFSLEYIRQRLHYDHLHFSHHRQAITFKFPQEVGPFFVKLRTSLVVIE
jgi:hypothetical protein